MSLKMVSIPCSQGICFRCEAKGCECECHTKPGMFRSYRELWPVIVLSMSVVVIWIVVVVVIKMLGGE